MVAWAGLSAADASTEVDGLVDAVSEQGATPLVVARRTGDGPGVLLGVIRLADVVKPGMRDRFADMRAMGIRTVMITGDNPTTARVIAGEAGVDDFLAEATPEDKMALIRSEQEEGLRGWSAVPIIVLSARTDSADKVHALDAGADDYVTKPFGMAELLARLRAAVRRAASGTGDGEPMVTTEAFTVDLTAKRVQRRVDETAEDVHLTPTEWAILEVLVRHRGRLVGQRQLLREVWGPAYGTETNYLRTYLAQLRRKLEADPARPGHLITEPGMGYRFEG